MRPPIVRSPIACSCALVVAVGSSAAHDAGEGALHDPAPLDERDAVLPRPLGHDVGRDLPGSGRPRDQRARVSADGGDPACPDTGAAQHAASPSRSGTLAAETLTMSSTPTVSTMLWRARPLIFLLAAHPREEASTDSVLPSDGASSTTALGLGSRPARLRTRARSASWTWSRVPS